MLCRVNAYAIATLLLLSNPLSSLELLCPALRHPMSSNTRIYK